MEPKMETFWTRSNGAAMQTSANATARIRSLFIVTPEVAKRL
jgi:hypothetical protein